MSSEEDRRRVTFTVLAFMLGATPGVYAAAPAPDPPLRARIAAPAFLHRHETPITHTRSDAPPFSTVFRYVRRSTARVSDRERTTLPVLGALRRPATSAPRPPGRAPAVPVQESIRLDRLSEAAVGDPLPPGWSMRAVGGAPSATSVVGLEGSERIVSFEGTGAAGQFWIELDERLDPAAGRLRWRWRVDEAIPHAVLTDPELDDAPARLFVVFGTGGLFSAPKILFYTWGGDADVPEYHRSHVNDGFGVVVVRKGDALQGRWLTQTRSPTDDYEAAFGERPSDPITAIGFMLDTDQTGSQASASLASIEWLPSSGLQAAAFGPARPPPAATRPLQPASATSVASSSSVELP